MGDTKEQEDFNATLTLDELVEMSRCFHCDMLGDEDRMEKYVQSIERLLVTLKASNKPTHVLDIGTGTGFLAMITARYSADRITACEACLPVARLAGSVISKNGLQDKVDVIAKSSWDLNASDIGGRADVAIAEIFDTELIGEGALRTFALAHKNLLKPNCHVLPCKASVFIRAIDSAYIRSWFRLDPSLFDSFGIQMPCQYTDCSMGPQAMNIHFNAIPKDLYTFVTDKFLIFQFDFNNAQSIALRQCNTVHIPLLNPGKNRCVDALLLWWELDMLGDRSIIISTDPFVDCRRSREHWLQALYGVSVSLSSKETEFTLTVSHDEFSFQFLPICRCAIHRICSFSQMSKLNDRAHYEHIVEHLKEDFRGKTFAFFSDLSFLPLIALKHGCAKVYCWLTSDQAEAILFDTALANGFTIGSDLVVMGRKDYTIPKDVDCLFCDLSFQLAGQSWHALEFWQTFCRLAKSNPRKRISIYPTLGRIYCVAVDLFDHWKFQNPKHLPLDIDISFAIGVVQAESNQQRRCWRPVCLHVGISWNVYEPSGGALRSDYSEYGRNVGTVNAILFWTRWFYDDNVELTRSPFENVVQPGGSICLDRSTKFGIYYLPEPEHILTLPASLNLHFQLEHLRSFATCKMQTSSMAD
ncbi:hypothetical protein D918_01748 [Trichuris suis]|nr:hypothetical protein D918_01748 [Trichuris suis]